MRQDLSDSEILNRLQTLENLLGVGQVIEPGAATIAPSLASTWNMAPGTTQTFFDTGGIKRVRLGALPSGD
ncbi:MAG: hypothetical protein WAM97_08740, partial [Acidimicrobiales bacterium]